MDVSYEIVLAIINLITNETKVFTKQFAYNIDISDPDLLYNNYHIISERVNMLALFDDEINQYCAENHIGVNNVDIDEFNIVSLTDKIDIFFESDDNSNQITLNPNIKCYVHPRYDSLTIPTLSGTAYNDNTIIWSWKEDGLAHYLTTDILDPEDENYKDKIIADIPIGTNTYTEINLEPNTQYTRRLVSYDAIQTSEASRPVTVQTDTAPIDISVDRYEIKKNYDFTADDSERNFINDKLEAFHSGVGDYNDLKVYKQMDADFYQKFKTYIQLRGTRTQREKRYDSVGFNYKVCLEATETVEEQRGEVTFDIDAYPREHVTVSDYMYATKPVTICARMECDVLLKKENQNDESIECPIKQPKWERITKIVQNEWVEDPPKPFEGELTIVISLDISGSMTSVDGRSDGTTRWQILKKASKDLIQNIEDYEKDGVALKDKVKYALTFYAKEAATKAGLTATQAKEIIDTVTFNGENVPGVVNHALFSFSPGNRTNHEAGLTNWIYAPGITNAVLEVFYTDGFANHCSRAEEVYSLNQGKEKCQAIYDTIVESYNVIHEQGVQCFSFFGASYEKDCDNSNYVMNLFKNSNTRYTVVDYDKQIYITHKDNADGCDFISINEYNSETIKQYLWNGLKKLIDEMKPAEKTGHYVDENGNTTTERTHTELSGWEFKGWETVQQPITLSTQWEIDDCRWAHVVIPPMNEDPWEFTIDDTITPVVYARNEERAIIPTDSIIADRNFDKATDVRQDAIKIVNQDIQSLVLEAVQQTQEWADGYTQLVNAYSKDDKKLGQYIIRGLFIKDTYMYGDEDEIPTVDFRNPQNLTDGYVGTLNVYADINKLDTITIGDDIYAVGPDKFVYLSGYTDAIIYDGQRIESFELNAYEHPSDTIITRLDTYGNLMWNRRNEDIRYDGSEEDIYHVLEIIAIDKDIYITEDGQESETLSKVNDWVLIAPSGTDISDPTKLVRGVTYPVIRESIGEIVAHNDEHYESPILNYRFSLEDPDAYTCYYEILPDCDPDSFYQHIILVHIYYARNIYIQDENKLSGNSTVYIESFGDDPIADTTYPYYSDSQPIEGQTYFRDDYIDDYIWFQAKPMMETRPYYDEKPNPGMDSFYGNVNGRYREDNKSGKKDLRVVTPKFNLPTTIDANDIKIYIVISEFYPETALVSYVWDNPSIEKDSITKKNGDTVTFSSDSLTYKDQVYNDLIQTITTEDTDVYDNKTTTHNFEIEKPLTTHTYDHYYIEVFTDNSDVLTLNYPNEVIFDDDGRTQFGVNFKGVVNATTKWSPRIHNGYYYLNQHEYYAYSEFNVEADFESYTDENYKNINGYLTIDVDLVHRAGPKEHYELIRNTRSELIQNEEEFVWVNGKGLTIKPFIDGKYYKQYVPRVYYSPILMFPHILTSIDRINVTYNFEDGSTELPMEVRSYDIENGCWSDWFPFSNGTVPIACPLSCAYQISFMMDASVMNKDKSIEDYMCCYLDWKEEQDLEYSTNIVTITDHLQPGPDATSGIFMSKIIDYGCVSLINISIFGSNRNSNCILYVATENTDPNRLAVENCVWVKVDDIIAVNTRYLRYKIEVPYNEKVYWLHKYIVTKESEVLLPYISQIRVEGDYEPVDVYDSFQEIQSFEIVTDGQEHRVFSSVYDLISGDITAKGFTYDEIKNIKLSCTTSNISIRYETSMLNAYPSLASMQTPVYATAEYDTKLDIQYTPFIFSNLDPAKDLDVINITKGTPQQYAPITVEDIDGIPYREVFDVDPKTLKKTEEFTILTEDDQHYIKLSRNDYDIKTLTIYKNGVVFTDYEITNNLITFDPLLEINDNLIITYNILFSFFTEIDYENDKTDITIYSNYDKEQAKKTEMSSLVPITTSQKYTTCDIGQIYASGIKEYRMNGAIMTDSIWEYDSSNNEIYTTENHDGLSIIVDKLTPVHSYSITVFARSEDSDNDVIGVLVGYVKDAANKTHTLTYLISLNKSSGQYIFNGCNTALVVDYDTKRKIVASKQVNCDYEHWDKMLNGISIVVTKQNNIVQCSISNWNDPNQTNPNSTISFDLNTDNDAKIFNKNVQYGFCVISQNKTYFQAQTFEGRVSTEISVDEQMYNLRHKYKVYFETNKVNNKFIAKNLSLNPVYRTDYKGFIYLTDEHNEPYKINIYCNPLYIKAGGYDKIDIAIECLDIFDNPVIGKEVHIDCNAGILNFDNTDAVQTTDINGVIHVLYESAVNKCVDTITARTETTDNKIISNSVKIVNE